MLNSALPQRRSRSFGFTLIELLVATTIMMLLVGWGIASYFRFNDRQQVAAVANEIKTLMEVAQTKARVKDLPTTGCSTLLSDYRVMVSGNTVVVQARCDAAGKTNASPAEVQTLANYTLDIPTGVTVVFDNPGLGPDTAAFLPLTGGVRNALDVTITGVTFDASFSLNASGDIDKTCVKEIVDSCP